MMSKKEKVVRVNYKEEIQLRIDEINDLVAMGKLDGHFHGIPDETMKLMEESMDTFDDIIDFFLYPKRG